MKKEAKIFNGWKTASSINGVGNTGELHVKQTHWIQYKFKMDWRLKYKA